MSRSMEYKHKIKMLIILLLLVFCAGCSDANVSDSQPITIELWHVYGAQTDSPLNDLIEVFNNTVGKKEGIQVEVTMVSNNNNIHKDIIAAANNETGAPDLPDIFVAYPKTILAMPDDNILVDYINCWSSSADFLKRSNSIRRQICCVAKNRLTKQL